MLLQLSNCLKILFLAAIALADAQPKTSACLNSKTANSFSCKPLGKLKIETPIDPTGVYYFYRLVNSGEGQRKCRLETTCSLFAVKAVERYGFFKGLLFGIARSQMEHSDQGGYLDRKVASDGHFIYLDPLENWKHDD